MPTKQEIKRERKQATIEATRSPHEFKPKPCPARGVGNNCCYCDEIKCCFCGEYGTRVVVFKGAPFVLENPFDGKFEALLTNSWDLETPTPKPPIDSSDDGSDEFNETD